MGPTSMSLPFVSTGYRVESYRVESYRANPESINFQPLCAAESTLVLTRDVETDDIVEKSEIRATLKAYQ